MSTTAGVGSQEYVAISGLAIVALLLGLASVMVLLTDVLFILPVAGVMCAIVAVRHIDHSNGTEAGKPWAFLGLALSILIGGGILSSRALGGWATRHDQQQIAGLIEALGRNTSQRSYGEAYDLFSPAFRERVTKAKFEAKLQELNEVPDYGALRGMKWNGLAQFDHDDADTPTRIAAAIALLEFERAPEQVRHQLLFVKQGDRWLIDDYENLFPREVPKRKQRGN